MDNAAKEIVKVTSPDASAIDPLINNGKTEVEAGGTCYLWTKSLLDYISWPESKRPVVIEYVSRASIEADDQTLEGGAKATAKAISDRVKKHVASASADVETDASSVD